MAHLKCLNSSQFPPLSLLHHLWFCCFLSVRQHSPKQKARAISPLVRDKHNEVEGYHLLQRGQRRRNTETFVPILLQGQGFKRNNFYLASKNILIKVFSDLELDLYRQNNYFVSTANSILRSLSTKQAPNTFSAECALKICGFADFTVSRVAQIKMQVRAESKPTLKLCQNPPAALACAWPMIFIPFHIVFHCIYTGMWGSSRHSQTGGCWETVPWISRQISNPDTDWSMPQQTPLCLPAGGKNTHLLKQDRKVREQKLREVEASVGRGKFTKWIERKSTRPGKEKEKE